MSAQDPLSTQFGMTPKRFRQLPKYAREYIEAIQRNNTNEAAEADQLRVALLAAVANPPYHHYAGSGGRCGYCSRIYADRVHVQDDDGWVGPGGSFA